MWLRRLRDESFRFFRSEDGPTATEYAFCLALMILVCMAAITVLGTKTNDLFPDLAGYL